MAWLLRWVACVAIQAAIWLYVADSITTVTVRTGTIVPTDLLYMDWLKTVGSSLRFWMRMVTVVGVLRLGLTGLASSTCSTRLYSLRCSKSNAVLHWGKK